MKKIEGVIKHYDWGGMDYLPQLLNRPKTGQPFGEYWLGTHPDGTAILRDAQIPLDKYLGKSLPFLLKILDVRNMLSIQVHPDKQTAERGYAEEEKSGKPRDAFDRVFKDNNHKPELMVALSEFWLVQGFKSDQEIIETLQQNPELSALEDYFQKHGLQQTYANLMTMPQPEVNAMLKPLGQRIKPLYEQNLLKKDDINFWAARAYFTFNQKGVCDRGIFSLYLMNLVRLNEGEGIFQDPGVLHAYLEGQNIECMATSDNVVRGGLTTKHVDTEQLLKIVRFESIPPKVIKPKKISDNQLEYPVPSPEFHLIKIVASGPIKLGHKGLMINLGPTAYIRKDGINFHLNHGESALVDTMGTMQTMANATNEEKVNLYFAYSPS